MKTNKNLKITKKGVDLSRTDGDSVKNTKLHKDKSTKRKLSIYDDFMDEDPNETNFNFSDDQFEDE